MLACVCLGTRCARCRAECAARPLVVYCGLAGLDWLAGGVFMPTRRDQVSL